MNKAKEIRHFKVIEVKKQPDSLSKRIIVYPILMIIGSIIGIFILKYMFLLGIVILSETSYFKISEIQVICNDQKIKEEVILLSGIDIGQRILPINLNELRKRIKRHPSVIEVKIKRKLPDQIIIHLQTRNPIAIALLEKMYYVDDGGVAYKQVGVLDNYDYPVITGVYTNELEVTERRLKDAVRILSALNAREFSTINRGLSELHYVNEGFVYIYLKGLRAGIKLYVPELEQEVPKVEKALRYLSENGLLDRTRQIAPYHRDGVAVALRERA